MRHIPRAQAESICSPVPSIETIDGCGYGYGYTVIRAVLSSGCFNLDGCVSLWSYCFGETTRSFLGVAKLVLRKAASYCLASVPLSLTSEFSCSPRQASALYVIRCEGIEISHTSLVRGMTAKREEKFLWRFMGASTRLEYLVWHGYEKSFSKTPNDVHEATDHVSVWFITINRSRGIGCHMRHQQEC